MEFVQLLELALTDTNVLNVAALEKALRTHHKAVAFTKGIPTNVGQWFRTLCDKMPVCDTERNAVEVLLTVVKYSPTKAAIKDAVDSTYMLPLHNLLTSLTNTDELQGEDTI